MVLKLRLVSGVALLLGAHVIFDQLFLKIMINQIEDNAATILVIRHVLSTSKSFELDNPTHLQLCVPKEE